MRNVKDDGTRFGANVLSLAFAVLAALTPACGASGSGGGRSPDTSMADIGGETARDALNGADSDTGGAAPSCRSVADCDDGNPCTADLCEDGGRCVHLFLGGPCDDGDACTSGDTCVDGGCISWPLFCPNNNDACTAPVCLPGEGCRFLCIEGPGCASDCLFDGECEDGDPESLDTCQIGPCSATCSHFWPRCDDGNPCTFDRPNGSGQCVHAPLSGSACDDGDACTFDETCVSGQCVGGELDCDDDDPCSIDHCDRGVGCYHEPLPDGVACDDGNACTDGETCRGGHCHGPDAVCPDDGDPCSLEYCDPGHGCQVYCRETGSCAPECVRDRECYDEDPCTIDECFTTT